jgi:predicted metalloprotease with PDZ domain
MKDRLLVYGVGTSPGLSELVDGLNKPYDFKFLKLGAGTGPSDHDSFYRKNVPVLFFFTGTHRDYHRPSDTPDKVNLPGVAKVAGLTFDVAQHFATVTEKPKYLVTKDRFSDPTETSPRASRPSMPKLGVMPGNYESTDGGVLVDDVSPGGAAQEAGLKAGDVIVEIGGKAVKNIEGYMTAMQAQKAGVPTDVVVLRKGQKLTLKATPKP